MGAGETDCGDITARIEDAWRADTRDIALRGERAKALIAAVSMAVIVVMMVVVIMLLRM